MTDPASGTSAARRAQYADGSTTRGKRTRGLLLAAAREVFERDGYLDTRVADIVAAAGVAHGTFYTYFESKPAVFRAVIAGVRDELINAVSVPRTTDRKDIGAYLRSLHRSNARFLEVYRKHRRMMVLFEQVATIDPEVGTFRVETRRAHSERIAAGVRRLQVRGLVRKDLDARTTGAALASMVGNFAYHWLAMGEPFDEDLALSTLTRLWSGALGLPVDGLESLGD